MKLIFLGAPGVGKGTIASKCASYYHIPHISTGDIFRAHIKNKTALGQKVSAILQTGGLVPDDLTIALVQEYLIGLDITNGYILDGFPRTIAQAEALSTFGSPEKAFLFSLSNEKIIERLSGRRVHKSSGRIYHVRFNPPKMAGKDDATGEELVQREDDREEAIQHRLEVYKKETAPLIEYYDKQRMLVTVDASPTPDNVFATLQLKLA